MAMGEILILETGDPLVVITGREIIGIEVREAKISIAAKVNDF